MTRSAIISTKFILKNTTEILLGKLSELSQHGLISADLAVGNFLTIKHHIFIGEKLKTS